MYFWCFLLGPLVRAGDALEGEGSMGGELPLELELGRQGQHLSDNDGRRGDGLHRLGQKHAVRAPRWRRRSQRAYANAVRLYLLG